MIADNTLDMTFATFGSALAGDMEVRNSIVRGSVFGDATFTYSNVDSQPGPGNFFADPTWVDTIGLDYHLLPGSPCIDSGDPSILDTDGSVSDIGAFPFATLYTVNPDWDQDLPSWPTISRTVGGRQHMRILGGIPFANRGYLTLGSVSGTTPGLQIQGQLIPLNLDAYFSFTAANPNNPILPGSFGTLDANGMGLTTFQIPGDTTAGPGTIPLHHATLLIDTGTSALLETTNALSLTLSQ